MRTLNWRTLRMEGNWVGMRGSGTVKIVGVHGVARRMGVKVPVNWGL